jgi:hypothetical protein
MGGIYLFRTKKLESQNSMNKISIAVALIRHYLSYVPFPHIGQFLIVANQIKISA